MSVPKDDRSAIRRMIRALKKVGAKVVELGPTDWGEPEPLDKLTEKAVLDAIMDYDDICVLFERKGPAWTPEKGYSNNHITLRFVMGNEPDEVVCDWAPYSEDENSLSKVVDKEAESWWS